ncbi:MAG: hypothetical protein K8S16_11440 [Bacteroidales bacterium]|nr:hypothetical protein [Bacteroidales bacterium]
MKFSVLLMVLVCSLIIHTSIAQAPRLFKYQTIVRSSDGSVLADTNILFRFTIIEDNSIGEEVYSETHLLSTSTFGLAQAEIGAGNVLSGSFENIDWGEFAYFLKTEIDLTNTDDFQLMGVSQLVSVPYALFAENVANFDEDWIQSGDDIHTSNIGNVAIGMTDPDEKLHVNGNIKTEDTLLFKGYINQGAGINNPGQVLIGERDIKIGYRGDNFGNILIGNSLYGKTVFDLTMTGNGNIGLGTDVYHETTTGYSNVCIGMYTGYNLSTGNNNVFIGPSAGEHISDGTLNICMGNQAGNGRNGDRNIFLGDRAGYAWTGQGSDNIMLGNFAGYKYNATNSNCVFIGKYAGYDVNSDNNIFIGPYGTGRSSVGEKNIFLGYEVGMNFTGDSYLLIDNKNNNSSPFIKGDMENDLLEINAELSVNGSSTHQSISVETVLNLTELIEFPTSPQEGDLIYMNDTLRFYNGIDWKKLW